MVQGLAQSVEFIDKSDDDFMAFMRATPGDSLEGGAGDDLIYGAILSDVFVVDAEAAGTDRVLLLDRWDSVDLSAVWLGDPVEEPPRTAAVHHSLNGHFAYREGRWKLIESKGSGGFTRVDVADDAPEGQLYDLRLDPGETTNLWDERPEVVARLRAGLAAVRGDD